jgi:FkbM family methyltransferase
MNFIEKLKLHYRARRYATKLDPGEIAYILKNVGSGQTALDIGAHKGGYLYFLQQKVGKTGSVHAFEPQAELYAYLKKMLGIMAWKNVTLENLALSADAGGAKLFIPGNKGGAGTSPGATLVPPQHRSDFNQVQEVATDSLDGYCEKRQLKPDFIKMDVEGNELTILQGGEKLLRSARPKLLVEIEARHVGRAQALSTIHFMKELGYRVFFICGKELLPYEKFDFDLHQNPEAGIYCNNLIFEP